MWLRGAAKVAGLPLNDLTALDQSGVSNKTKTDLITTESSSPHRVQAAFVRPQI